MFKHSFGNNFAYGFSLGLFNNNYPGCSMFNPFSTNYFPMLNYTNPLYNSCSLFTFPQWNFNNFSNSLFTFPSFNSQRFMGNNNNPQFYNVNQEWSTPSTVSTNQNDNNTKEKAQQSINANETSNKTPEKTQANSSYKNCPITATAEDLKQRWKSKNKSLSNEFYNKIIDISNKINCAPDDLMALIFSESSFDPKAKNKYTGAIGLIQFMPNTAKELGTSCKALSKMSREEQLVYVEKYLMKAKKWAGYSSTARIDTGTLYALTFLPALSKQEKLAFAGTKRYSQNSGLDKNNDGVITKTDLANRLKSYYA